MLENLQPNAVLTFFEEICAIPHGSYHTEKISQYLVDFALGRGLTYRQDQAGNVIIWKEASSGHQAAAPLILQGHMDMVCEKEGDCGKNMDEEGLDLVLEDGFLTAQGTTLGADDGVALAMMLALLADDAIVHPPLECVFTVDEEVGMLGAAALDCSDLMGRRMINLDNEEEGHFLVSCAGGATQTLSFDLEWQEAPAEGKAYELSLTGLVGGHSGTEIHRGRGNASLLLARVVRDLYESDQIMLCQLEGGSKDNAIPREAKAVLVARKDLSARVEEWEKILKEEYGLVEKGLKLSLKPALVSAENGGSTSVVWAKETTEKVLAALELLPNGVQAMSQAIPDFVETSLNLGIMKTEKGCLSLTCSVRSSLASKKKQVMDQLSKLAKVLGGKVEISGDYPGWSFKESSSLQDSMAVVYEKMYGEKPMIEGIHAGVECGIFADKLPGLDCLSIGPDLADVHTPMEKMDLASLERTWNYMLELMKELA
ncbi:MAG: aminoacyl-histidine dipeptidase [Eubacterium sp.]|nr:aminoacyl-histidine dipeptidase [Eubacterium sp.]